MVQVSFVSKVAAKMGSDEFFDPLMLMRPLSGAPPCTMSFSMVAGFVLRIGEVASASWVTAPQNAGL
jgi:hypothetical protein